MKLDSTVPDRILEAMAKVPACRIEELVHHFPDLTWSQVFCEVNRLSRNGQLRLTLDGQGGVTLRRSNEGMAEQSFD